MTRAWFLLIPALLVVVEGCAIALRCQHRRMEEEAARLSQLIRQPVQRFLGSDEALPVQAARRRAGAEEKRQDADRIVSRPASTENRVIPFTGRR